MARVNSLGIASFRKFPWYQFEPLYGVIPTQGVRWWRQIFRHVTPSRDILAPNPKSEWLVFHYNHCRFWAKIKFNGVIRTQRIWWWCRFFRHVTLSRDFFVQSPKSPWWAFRYNHYRFGAIIKPLIYQWLLKVTWGHLGSFKVIQGHWVNFKMSLKLFKTHGIASRLAKWMTSSDPKWPQVTSCDPMWPLVTSRDLLRMSHSDLQKIIHWLIPSFSIIWPLGGA